MTLDLPSISAIEFFSGASAWTGHVPFGMTLIKTLRPALFVELGAYRGDSYLAFCQAVAENGLETRCFAVDSWVGDNHTGDYEEAIYQRLRSYNAARYEQFSSLLRMDFTDAADRFEAGTIDLLHIDGLHTYDAVRHDFETWLPKVSSRGVVLFHDTRVRHKDFGVYRFWEEISPRYPSIEFTHSSGLGVLCVGTEPSPWLLQICHDSEHADRTRTHFERLGELLELEARHRQLGAQRGETLSLQRRKTLWTRVRNEVSRGMARLRHAA